VLEGHGGSVYSVRSLRTGERWSRDRTTTQSEFGTWPAATRLQHFTAMLA